MKIKTMCSWTVIISALICGDLYFTNKIKKAKEIELKRSKDLSDKHLRLFMMMNCWTNAKIRGVGVVDYLKENNAQKVAVYGLSYAGQTLINELEQNNIEIAYGVDQNPDFYCQNFDVLSPDEDLPNVDIMIITAISSFEDIKERLKSKIDCRIVSLEEIVGYI